MANEIKYKPQIWGKPIEGERLSTNGHYRGEQLGSSTQDALVEITPHYVEETIIRRGTITQDVLNKIEQASDLVEIGSGYTLSEESATSCEQYNRNGFCYGNFWCSVGNYVSFSNDPTGQKYKVTEFDDEGMNPYMVFDGDYCPGYYETVTIYKDPKAWTCGNCGSTNRNEDEGYCEDCYYEICPRCGEWKDHFGECICGYPYIDPEE